MTFKSVVHSHFLCTNFYGAKRMVQFSICSILCQETNVTPIFKIRCFLKPRFYFPELQKLEKLELTQLDFVSGYYCKIDICFSFVAGINYERYSNLRSSEQTFKLPHFQTGVFKTGNIIASWLSL